MKLYLASALVSVAVLFSGCALFNDPVAFGVGESKAEFVTVAEDGTVTYNTDGSRNTHTYETVDGDRIVYSGKMIADNFMHNDTMVYRAPEEQYAPIYEWFMESRKDAGPFGEHEITFLNGLNGVNMTAMSQQNLKTRHIIAQRETDSEHGAEVSKHRAEQIKSLASEGIEAAVEVGKNAVNPAGTAAVEAFEIGAGLLSNDGPTTGTEVQ